MALTEQKRRYAEARLSGMTKKDAAIQAGCPAKTASQAASRYEKDPDVQAAMSRTVAVEAMKAGDPPPVNSDVNILPAADDPKDYLLSVMNNLGEDPKLRLDAAKALMPYVHGKVAEQGKKDAKSDAAKAAGRGKFAAAAPPLRAVK